MKDIAARCEWRIAGKLTIESICTFLCGAATFAGTGTDISFPILVLLFGSYFKQHYKVKNKIYPIRN